MIKNKKDNQDNKNHKNDKTVDVDLKIISLLVW